MDFNFHKIKDKHTNPCPNHVKTETDKLIDT